MLAAIPTWGTQLAGALVFGPARCLQWACYFQFLGDEVRYPPAVTGRVLGYNNLAIAIVGDVMPYGLAYATVNTNWDKVRKNHPELASRSDKELFEAFQATGKGISSTFGDLW